MSEENLSTDPIDTPWEPLSLREKIAFGLIRFVTWVFRIDFFDVYRRQNVEWSERDEYYRIGMGSINTLKKAWLEVYKIQAEFYDDNDDDDWVPYAMGLVMRSDPTLNSTTVLSGKRNDAGEWETTVSSKPSMAKRLERKEELVREVDKFGFIPHTMDVEPAVRRVNERD